MRLCDFERVIDSTVAVINWIEEKSYWVVKSTKPAAAETKHHFSEQECEK